MYDLFQERATTTGGVVFPEFRRIRDGLRASIARVVQFRQDNPMGLAAAHPLVRLLMSLNVPLSMEPMIYRGYVAELTYPLARSFRFASTASQGQVFTPSMFYGDNVSEAILLHKEDFDLTGIEDRWKDLQPIRVLYHPQTDLNLHVPDGRHPSVESGMAVVAINLPMLALQYKLWRRWERGAVVDESPRTVMQFLMAFPLPNMLYSHLDTAIFNRLFSIYFEQPMPEVRQRHSFRLIDWHHEVDDVLLKYIGTMERRRADFDTLIEAMPTAGYDTRFESLQLPNMPFTYQWIWTVVIARLAPVMFMVQFASRNQSPRNRTELAYLKRFFTRVDQAKMLRVPLPSERYQEALAIIEQGILPYLDVT